MASAKHWVRIGAVVACGLALAASREFYIRSVVPQRLAEADARRDVAELKSRIASAKSTIAQMRGWEQETDLARNRLDRIESDLPVGTAAVRLPALLKGHFARFGIAMPLVRLNTVRDEPDIPGCERGSWSVALPVDAAGRNIMSMFVAVADLEQQNSFIKVVDFGIRPDPENPGGRLGVLNVAGLIRKQSAP